MNENFAKSVELMYEVTRQLKYLFQMRLPSSFPLPSQTMSLNEYKEIVLAYGEYHYHVVLLTSLQALPIQSIDTRSVLIGKHLAVLIRQSDLG